MIDDDLDELAAHLRDAGDLAGEVMSEERLKHLRGQIEQAGATYAEMAGQEWAGQYAQDMAEVLAEVERQRGVLEALARAIRFEREMKQEGERHGAD